MTGSTKKSPLSFFLLSLVLATPVFIFADVVVFPNIVLMNFGAFIPAFAALILSYRENKFNGMKLLLLRSFDFNRIRSKIWYFPILFLIPFTVLIQCVIGYLSGIPISSPVYFAELPLLIIILFIAALGEELGWMGYAFDPMEERLGALKAAVILGIIWSLIHIPLFTSSNVSSYWIIWQLFYIAATRVLFAWVYNNSGKSVFAVAVMHTLFNTVWLLFPRNPQWVTLARPLFYNPTQLALASIIIAVIITFFWGSKTLTKFRYNSNS